MKHKFIQRALALLLALVCVMGILPLSAFAAERSSAPGSITQKSSDYMKIGGQSVRYRAASSTINNVGLPYVFNEQVDVPGYGTTRALCAYQKGTLGPAANGQKWNFKNEVNSASLKVLLTYIYSHTYGDFEDAGNAIGLEHWNQYWSNIWFLVAQAMSWYYEHGIIIDINSNKEGFIEQCAEEFVAAMKLYHKTYGQSSWITDWDSIGTHSIIDSKDGGVTGISAYDYVTTGVNLVLEHPEYYHEYHLWIYEWDKSQPWKLAGQSGVPMQRLLIAVPEDRTTEDQTVQLTVKKLEAGTNKPLPGVTFKVESSADPSAFSITRETGPDGTFTLTDTADGLIAGQYLITEVAAPPGYVAQTASQLVTVMPNGSANSVFTFFNVPDKKDGDGSIRKVNADNPTQGIPGAVIRITSVKLDNGGSFTSEYTTKDGGYILKEDLDFKKLPTGSYIAEEITPPEGFVLSSDVSKVKQAFVWDGEHDISLIFENSPKVKIKLLKVDESNNPLPGAIFVVLRDGQVIATEKTQDDGTITISDVVEGYYEFREVDPPEGFDKDSSPVGVYVTHEDIQGEKTITVTKMNHHKRDLIIQKRDAETGAPVPDTSFHVRGINNGYENDVVTLSDGKVTISDMPSGCYEIEETKVPSPYILDTNNRKTVWIDAEKDQDVVVDFVNSTRPGLRLMKIDAQTGEPLSGVQFRIREVNGSYNELHFTDKNGMIILEGMNPGAYTIQETKPKNGWVADDTIHTVYLEENKTTTIELSNLRKPDLFIKKVDSITGSPIKGVKFQIWRGSDDTQTGEYNDLGTFYTDENGLIHLVRANTGWYKIQELEPAPGYTIKEPAIQEIYLEAGKDHTVTFENTPKNAIVVEKYDSVTHQALPGCTFQLRYLGGSSGTGGTVIGQKVTGKNGMAMWTGLNPGTYIIEEVDPADGYHIVKASETVYLADSGEQSVVTVRFNNSPDGSLLLRKVCATNPSVTLQNAEFKVAYSDGTLIGDANGIFRSDENGEVHIDGLTPGKSVVVTEVRAPAGFILDTQSQTIQVKEGRTVVLTFKNQPKGKLILQKRDSQTNEVLPGAQFRITTAAGCEVGLDGVIGTSSLTSNGIFTTDSQGEIRISNLAPGAYVISEIKAPDGGYVIDTPSTNVVIGQGGDTQTIIVTNTRKGGLVIEKYDKITRQPLSGARFKVMMANGELTPDNEGLTSSNGLYTTDVNGQIVLSKLLPGTYVVSEDLAPDNYRKDPTPQTVVVNAGDTQTIRFYDDPLCTLQILKRDAVTKKPLKGAEFLVRDSSGHVIGPNNGLYTTGTDGTVTVSGLAPNSTIVVSEKRAPTGYVLDETPKNIVVRSGVANSLIFDNEPGTTLIIRKFIEGTENEPLSGVCFRVVDGSGAAVGPDDGRYYTDKAGEIVLEGIEPGTTVKVREIKTVEGFVLDGTPQDILIKGGEVQQLTFWNKRAGTLVIEKKDSLSGALISGAQFQLTYANGGYVDNDNGHLSSNGLYTTDDKGQIRIDGIVGTVVAKEVKAAPGYVIDQSTQVQTVTVNPMDTQTLTFMNEPLCSLTVTKLDSVTGKPVPNTQFAIKDGSGNVLARCTTGKDGTATVTGLAPNSTVVVVETRVPSGYVLNSTPQTIIVRNGGNTVTSSSAGNSGTVTTPGANPGGSTGTGNDLTFENDPKQTLTIHKYIEGTKNEPLAGVTFKLVDGSGTPVGPSDGTFVTDSKGEIVVEGLEPGTTITAQEVKTVEGFVLDGTPKSVKIKAGEGAPSLTFWNAKAGELVIRKLDSVTKQPLAGVEFELTYAGGGYVDNADGHLSSNGLYTTDSHGEIHISGVTGTIVVKETRTIDGYTIDESTRTQTVKVNPQDTQVLTFYNDPKQTLTIQKYVDGTTDPIQGVHFLVTDSSGKVLGPNNGEYITDKNGRIVIEDITPGTTITAKETRTISGYVLDTTPQSILIKEGEAQTLTFYNKSEGGLELVKVSKSDKTQRIPNTTFEIRKMDGGLVETVTTDSNGRIHVNLEAGDYYAVEIEAGEGFKLDNTPQYFTVKDGKTTTLTVTNEAFSGIIIHKVNSVTKDGIYGVKFLVYDQNKNPIGEYTTDDQGYIYIDDLTVKGKGKLFIRELEAAEGYELDKEYKTVYVQPGKTIEIEWENVPITGQFQIRKYAAEYNEVTGTAAGAPLKGAVYEISEARSGKVVDYITTDARGVAASKPLPLGRYKITEVTAPPYWKLSGTVFDETLEYSGQIIKLSDYDKPSNLGVTITKRGNAQALAGSQMRYDITVGNTSNVALENFYWHDRVPTDATRATVLTTGTYSARLNYRVLYKTNYRTGYQVLASNLLTSSNYSFSLNAIPMQAGEYVTDVYFDFGKVPVGFQSTINPTLTVQVLGTVANNYQIINRADVGGKYQGTWETGQATWLTIVRRLTPPNLPTLPKTGY